MSSGPRIPYTQAIAAAALLIANVAHCCERIDIVGSLRRHTCNPDRPAAATVGDIEIVAIPLWHGKTNLLWQRMELLKYRLWEGTYATTGKTYHRAGPLFRKYWVPSPGSGYYSPRGRDLLIPRAPDRFPCELYLATRENYGYITALRTGPDDFNRLLVRDRAQNGLKPPDITLDGGKVWMAVKGSEVDRVQWLVPHESDFFRAMELAPVPPHLRSGDVAAMLAYHRVLDLAA